LISVKAAPRGMALTSPGDGRKETSMELSRRKLAQVIVMGHEMPRTEREFHGFVERMNEDEQAELVAIFWVGRGSFEAEDFAEALATARAEASTPTADYLLGSPHFADHLEAGAEALGIEVSDEEEDLM